MLILHESLLIMLFKKIYRHNLCDIACVISITILYYDVLVSKVEFFCRFSGFLTLLLNRPVECSFTEIKHDILFVCSNCPQTPSETINIDQKLVLLFKKTPLNPSALLITHKQKSCETNGKLKPPITWKYFSPKLYTHLI